MASRFMSMIMHWLQLVSAAIRHCEKAICQGPYVIIVATPPEGANVDILASLSPLAALIGVWIGGQLTLKTQRASWERAERQHWRDTRQVAYTEFLGAIRDYRSYIGRTTTTIGVRQHADGRRLMPEFEPSGSQHIQRLDAAFAQVQLVSPDQTTVDAARFAARVSRRTAVAKALNNSSSIPYDFDVQFWDAQLSFVNAVRAEFSLPAVSNAGHHDTQEIDRLMIRKFEDQSRQSSEHPADGGL
jgi:hypothetical protein